MAEYITRRSAQVWAKPTGQGPIGNLASGERVSVGWFWPTGFGQITSARFNGRYVNQTDLQPYVPAPEPPPTVPEEGERMVQYDADGNIVQVWVPE